MSTNTQQSRAQPQYAAPANSTLEQQTDFVLKPIMMFCSRCLLSALFLYSFLEDLSAFLLPDRLRIRRNAEWPDKEASPHWSELSDLADLFPGDPGETTQDWGSRHNQPSPFLTPLQRLTSSQHVSRNRRKHKHKHVTAPLDSIGGGLLSSHHSRKDEPEDIWKRIIA